MCTVHIHPGGRNDLTLSHYDEYLQAMRRGLYKDHTFQVYSGNGDEKVTVSNLHAFTDNGFHQWLETQFPSKVSREVWLRRWSKRGESFRKPGTECIYGILKKRFRILKQEIPFTDAASIDNVFRFLVSLHNRMQRFYGLDTLGEHVEDWQMATIDIEAFKDSLPLGLSACGLSGGALFLTRLVCNLKLRMHRPWALCKRA